MHNFALEVSCKFEILIYSVCKKNRTPRYYSFILKSDTNIFLTTCQGKLNKDVVILHTVHHSVESGTDEKKIPETIKFRNSTKIGVDILDHMT